jgi:hypothetical protein
MSIQSGRYTHWLPCEERDRLTSVYLDAVAINIEAGKTVADIKSESWRIATQEPALLVNWPLRNSMPTSKEHGWVVSWGALLTFLNSYSVLYSAIYED